MTVEELRDELNRLIAAGRGGEKVMGWACQYEEGDAGWFELEEVWTTNGRISLHAPFDHRTPAL